MTPVDAIDVRGITKRFGTFTAVDHISFQVKQGEIFGMLGPNGAGKSTLIRMLTTLMPPTEGTAIVGGSDVRADPDGVRRAIGVIPQAMTSDLELSAEENLLIFSKLYGVPRKRRKELIRELLAAVELTAWADKPVKQLSGGMRRRVEIARGLVHEPRIFFLDEADKLCDRIAIVDHGVLKALDTPLRLKAEVSGKVTLEVGFGNPTPGWLGRLAALPGVESVAGDDRLARVSTGTGPATTMALLELTTQAGVTVQSLSVNSTTLDDVFVHFTGRQLRDALQEPSPADRSVIFRR